MKNTSLGFHTFSVQLRVNYEYFTKITSDFIRYANNLQNGMKRYPVSNGTENIGWRYVYEYDKGLQWYLYSFESGNGYLIQGVTAIINPKVLIDNNYIHAAQSQDIKLVKEIFNKRAKNISPYLYEFDQWSTNRIDYCLNIDTKELELPCTAKQLMKLVKRANIPKHFKEHKEYHTSSHRQKSDPNSFYLQSKSVTINFYHKFFQQSSKHPNYANRYGSYNVLRFEIQCKYPKLYTMSKFYKPNECNSLDFSEDLVEKLYYDYIETGISPPTINSDTVLPTQVSYDMIEKYIFKTLRKGDYFTFDIAQKIVESYNFRPEKEERLLYALDIVSTARGIAAAKEKILGLDLDDFKRSLNDLDEILVNPVTIPIKWNINHIPNPIRAYCDAIYEECLIPRSEYMALQHIKCYIED